VMMQGQDLRQVAAHRVVEMGIAHVPEHRRHGGFSSGSPASLRRKA
jgi:ABC-type branched-subunit amino acid transport system ATPase component